MAANKVVIPLVSLILVVGVVCGAVVVLHNGGKETAPNVEEHITTGSMKATVTTFCQYAEYKDQCARSIAPVANNQSATTKDYILAILKATIDEVRKSHRFAVNTKVDKNKDPYTHVAIEDCKDMLQDAVDDLQASLSVVGNAELHTLNDRAYELLNWVSAVYAYQTTCLEQVKKPKYRSALEHGMINATQLTNNAINIIAEMSKVLQAFNITAAKDLIFRAINGDKPSHSRRLLDDEFPSWFPASDRKLLAAQRAGRVVPHAIVSKGPGGKFKTIQAALNAHPPNHQGKYIIYVKAGIYNEYVEVRKKVNNDVFMYGDGAGKTIITGNKNSAINNITTSKTATFFAHGERFVGRGMTIRNTAGPQGHQAVAYRSQSENSALFDCSIEGYQDTLYYHTYMQFYHNCVISGTIDFIFGKGAALIQNSVIIARKPMANQTNTITADGKELQLSMGGVVLQNCTIKAEPALFPERFKVKTYLGRPWKAYSTAVVMETEIGDVVSPEGWMTWYGATYENTCIVYEYANWGPGKNTTRRNRAFKNWAVINRKTAARFTARSWIKGNTWLPSTGGPFFLGFSCPGYFKQCLTN